MRGRVPLLLALAAVAAAATVACGGLAGTFLPLERAIPLNQQVELEALRARDRARHGRILQGVVRGVIDFSVQGTSDPYFVGYGLYFTKVKLGSPAKEFYVQIDTGSDILWINCITCSNCPHSSGLGIELDFFDTAGSSTAALVSCADPICSYAVQTATSGCSSQANQCSYTFQYGDGSGTTGYYVSDTMYFDTVLLGQSVVANSSSTIVFGCSTYQSGDLTKTDKAVDGIFGFGPGALSVISQLSSRGVTPKVFSHCLKGGENGGGVLVLGEILEPSIVYSPLVPSHVMTSTSLHLAKYVDFGQYCYKSNGFGSLYIRVHAFSGVENFLGVNEGLHPLLTQTVCFHEGLRKWHESTWKWPHYNLNLQSIAVNGQLLPIDSNVFATTNNQGTIVDSGTTLAYLVQEAYNPFVDAITAAVSQFSKPIISKGNQCYLVSNSVGDIFPQVSLNFMGGASMALNPEHYLMHYGFLDSAAMWCIGFQKVERGFTILGDLVLKDKIFVYDLAKQRIGWADYDCSLAVNVSLATSKSKDAYINSGQMSMTCSLIGTFSELLAVGIVAFLVHIIVFMECQFL